MNPASRGTELFAGAALIVALALTVVVVFWSVGGGSGRHVDVTAEISQVGDSLEAGNIVTFREVIVGEVRGFHSDGAGGAVLDLRIEPDQARAIPRDVTAVGIPADLFGQTAILLSAPAASDAPALSDGDHVRADTSPGARGLQSALSEVYDVISTIEPAQLNGALSAISLALRENGSTVGTLIDHTDELTQKMVLTIPRLAGVLESLGTVSQQLAASSPDLLSAVENLLVPAQAVVAEQDAIAHFFAVVPPALDSTTDLTRDIGDNAVTVVTNAEPVLAALAQNAEGLAGSVTGFGSMADAFNSVIHDGRVKVNAYVTGVNSAALVPLFLGQPSQVLDSTATPLPSETARVTADRHETPASAVAGPQEVALVQSLVSSLSDVPANQVPEGATLLLGPLLRGLSTVIR